MESERTRNLRSIRNLLQDLRATVSDEVQDDLEDALRVVADLERSEAIKKAQLN